jgi:hypothetical protein
MAVSAQFCHSQSKAICFRKVADWEKEERTTLVGKSGCCQTKSNTSQSTTITQIYEAQI